MKISEQGANVGVNPVANPQQWRERLAQPSLTGTIANR